MGNGPIHTQIRLQTLLQHCHTSVGDNSQWEGCTTELEAMEEMQDWAMGMGNLNLQAHSLPC